MEELTGLQWAFVNEYIIDFNGTQAARRAGYQGDDNALAVTASRLLRNAKVADAVRERLHTRAMTADEVLSRLADVARFDPSAYFIKKRSKTFINLDAIKADGMGHVIKEIGYDRKGNLVVKFDDRQNALLNIGKQYGLFSDKHVVEMKLEKEIDVILDKLEGILPPELYDRILAAISGTETGEGTLSSPSAGPAADAES